MMAPVLRENGICPNTWSKLAPSPECVVMLMNVDGSDKNMSSSTVSERTFWASLVSEVAPFQRMSYSWKPSSMT